jgi:hypothetical protein
VWSSVHHVGLKVALVVLLVTAAYLSYAAACQHTPVFQGPGGRCLDTVATSTPPPQYTACYPAGCVRSCSSKGLRPVCPGLLQLPVAAGVYTTKGAGARCCWCHVGVVPVHAHCAYSRCGHVCACCSFRTRCIAHEGAWGMYVARHPLRLSLDCLAQLRLCSNMSGTDPERSQSVLGLTPVPEAAE